MLTHLLNPGLSISAGILLIIPFNYQTTLLKKYWSVFHFLLVILILIVLNVVNLYYRITIYYDSFTKMHITDCFLNTYTFFVCVTIVVENYYFHKNSRNQILETFNKISINKNVKLVLNLNFYSAVGMYLVYICSQSFLYSISTRLVYCVIIPIQVDIYLVLIVTLCFNNYAVLFKQRFRVLSNNLKKDCLFKEYSKSRKFMNLSKFDTYYNNLNKHFEEFINIIQGISAFNSIYGLQVVLILGVILFFITDHVKLLIYEVVETGWENDQDDLEYAIRILAIKFWNCCNLTVNNYLYL